MTQATGKRRGHGEDSIYRDASRNRFIGAVDLGFGPNGTRIRKKVSGKTKAEVRDKLMELHKEIHVGLRPRRRYTVGDALEAWLAHGVDGLSERTVTLYRGTIVKALNEELGGVRLAALTASDVQKALTALAAKSSTRTVRIAHNVLVRAIWHAERDDLAGRNVAARAGGDTKTPRSRRTLALPRKCVEALREHRVRQARDRLSAGPLWKDHRLVFASAVGTPLDDYNVRRQFRVITQAAGLGKGWVPRELRHTFVSLLSAHGCRSRRSRCWRGITRPPPPSWFTGIRSCPL